MNTRNVTKESNTFRQLAGRGEYSPDQSIIGAIDNRSFPIADNLFFGFCPQHLANKEWQRCLRLFETRLRPNMPNVNPQNFFQVLMMEWMNANQELDRMETPIKEELIALSQEVVREIYGMEPEDVELNADILPPNNNGFDSRDSEDIPDFKREEPDYGSDAPGADNDPMDDNAPISEEREEYIREEAQKRIIMNGFAHGSAIHIWKSSYYIAQERLNELNPQLVEWYDKYAALVSFLMWMFPTEQMKQMIESNSAVNQGWNKAGFKQQENQEQQDNEDERPEEREEEEQDTPVITGVGMNFPVLLHELSKGVVEIISYHGIPQDLTVKEMELYYQIADEYTLEPWFYFLAPTLWSDMVTVINKINEKVDNGTSDLEYHVEIPEALQYLFSLDYDALAELSVFIVHDQDKAISAIEEAMVEIEAENAEEESESEDIVSEITDSEAGYEISSEEGEKDLSEKDFETLTAEELSTLKDQAVNDEDYILASKCQKRLEEIKKA